MTDAAALLSKQRASVVAAAGCGKTQLIASAVEQDGARCSLVLTHTHAGVDALRKRLRSVGAPVSAYEIDTIAGWSLRLVRSFPATSGITTSRPSRQEWNNVYRAVVGLLAIGAIQAVARASFDAVYVDEYQDCSRPQHAVVLALAAILPTRVLGDPLQGIFGFGESELVNWGTDVEPHFAPLEPLSQPHRWVGKNTVLGSWLGLVRDNLDRGEPIDLRCAPNGAVKFVQLPGDPQQRGAVQRQICLSMTCPSGESLVAIHGWEAQCHKVARDTGGKFRSLETMECEDLFRFAGRFDDAGGGQQLAQAVFEFTCLCLTRVKTDLGKTAARILDGRGLQANRTYRHREQLDALAEVMATGSLASARRALVVVRRSGGAAEARYELFHEMLAALREHETGKHGCLKDAAVRSRDRTRRSGREPSRYVVARTLLVKGLEFDHALVLDARALDRRNLYVALTRASRSLTVLSDSPVLTPL